MISNDIGTKLSELSTNVPDRRPTGSAPRNTNIDILRAIAILMVMFVHFPRIRQLVPFLNPWSGVDLFFAISGYVVAKSFVPRLEDAFKNCATRSDQALIFALHTKAFFIRRFMRITPALAFALGIYILIGIAFQEPTIGTFSNVAPEVFSILTYTANFYAAYSSSTVFTWHWSLAAEEQFYFLFPFFILLVKSWKHRILATVVGICLISFIIRPYGSSWFGAAPAMMYLPQFRNDAIGYGFLLFAASQQTWFSILRINPIDRNPIVLLSVVAVLTLIIAFAPELSLNFNIAIPIIGITSTILLYFAVVSESIFVSWQPLASILKWVGIRSYGIYLLHIPTVRLVQHFESLFLPTNYTFNVGIHLLIIAAVIGILVEITYQFIELPAMRLGIRWSKEILDLTPKRLDS
jgi:peptidoglycan/LPS O-acetylase OafA/YrhL